MKYYKKLLKTYIIIASTFIIVVSLILLFAFQYTAYQEQRKNTEVYFTHACEHMDTIFSSLSETIQLISSDNHFNNYARENAVLPDRYNRLQLNKLLINISTINQLDCSILVTKLTDDYYCSNFSSGELKFGLKKLSIPKESFDEIINSFSSEQTTKYITESRFMPIYPDENTHLFVVASRIWVNATYPVYIFAVYEQNDLFAIINTDTYKFSLIQGNQPLLYNSEINYEGILQPDGTSNTPLLLQKDSSFYDQTFTYIMTMPKLFTPNILFILVILCCITALFFSVLAMKYLTKKMYEPIKETLDATTPTTETGDEFVFIQSHISSLYNNVQKLEHQLLQYHTPAQAKFIHDLLMGLVPQEKIHQLYNQYHITPTAKYYVVVLVQINLPQPSMLEDTYSVFYSIRSQIVSSIEENNNLHLFQVLTLTPSEQAYIFFETDNQNLAEVFRSACSLPTEYSNIDITIAIGSTCFELNKISHSFMHASHLITQAQYVPSALKVLIYGESPDVSSTSYTIFYPINVEQALINAVINGKRTIWENLLKTLIDTNQQKNPYNRNHLPLMLTATIDRILNATNISADKFLDDQKQIYQLLYACKTYETLYENTYNILNKLSQFLSQEALTDTQLLRLKMLDYIHTNYNRDISLQDLADHLNMSKNYVSSLFKEIIGHNFKDYLGEYRINKACELIEKKNGNVKLLDVASAIGCNSSSLQRLFSHYKGMTPSEWVNHYIQNK